MEEKTRYNGLMSALNNTGISTFIYYPKENKICVSPRAVELYHCRETYENALYSFADEFVSAEDRQIFLNMYLQIDAGEPVSSASFWSKDHLVRCLVTMTTVRTDDAGLPEEVVGIVENETRNEEYRQELNRYFSAVACGILQYTRDTKKLIYVNELALKILGYSSKEELA